MLDWAAVLVALKPYLIPFLTWLVGWFMPSPAAIYRKRLAAIQAAEKNLDVDKDASGLDKLP